MTIKCKSAQMISGEFRHVGEQRKKLLRQIERLEQKTRCEKQPKRKWELVEKVKHLNDTMDK